jgi:hypothetical protein
MKSLTSDPGLVHVLYTVCRCLHKIIDHVPITMFDLRGKVLTQGGEIEDTGMHINLYMMCRYIGYDLSACCLHRSWIDSDS